MHSLFCYSFLLWWRIMRNIPSALPHMPKKKPGHGKFSTEIKLFRRHMCHIELFTVLSIELHTSLNNGPIVICTIRLLSKWYYKSIAKFSRLDKSGGFLYSWKNLLRNIGILKWISRVQTISLCVSSELDLKTMETRITARSQSAVWWARWVFSLHWSQTSSESPAQPRTQLITAVITTQPHRATLTWSDNQTANGEERPGTKHASCSTEAHHQSF